MKIISIVVLLALAFLGTADAAQVGIKLSTPIPQHGHSRADDGGVLKTPIAKMSATGNTSLTAGLYNTINFSTVVLDPIGGIANTTADIFNVPTWVTSFDVTVCLYYSTGTGATVDILQIYDYGHNTPLHEVNTITLGTGKKDCWSFIGIPKNAVSGGVSMVSIRYLNSGTGAGTAFGTVNLLDTMATIRLYR